MIDNFWNKLLLCAGMNIIMNIMIILTLQLPATKEYFLKTVFMGTVITLCFCEALNYVFYKYKRDK